MKTSDSAASVLARIAKRNDGESVTFQALIEWVKSGECPPQAIEAAAWSMLDLLTRDEDWYENRDIWVKRANVREPENGCSDSPPAGPGFLPTSSETPLPHPEPRTRAHVDLLQHEELAVAHFVGRLVGLDGQVTDGDELISIAAGISTMLEMWNGLPIDERPRNGFPLEILYLAWLNQPKQVNPNTRSSGRIIPGKLAQVAPGDRQAGKLFAFAAHVAHAVPDTSANQTQMVFSGFNQAEVTRQQFVLPGFKDSTTIGPCLPLALYDLGDAPATSRGPAAPLPLRLFVEAVLAVPMDSRDTHNPVAMRVTLRHMLEWLYPSPRKPRPNEYWPRLIAAFEALDSPEARIPWYDPVTGQGGLRRIVNISDIPRGPAKLDDLISVIVDLPPESGNGPQVSDNLRQWGIKSAAGYRALLNLAYRWFEPGRTHFPVGKGRRRYWAQANDPERYPSLTDNELIALCFPTSTRSARRNLVSDARKVIRQLEQEGELRVVEGKGSAMKILPPLAADKASA